MTAVQVSNDVTKDCMKAAFKESLDPLAVAHFNGDGAADFRALLYIPGMAPFENQVPQLVCELACVPVMGM